MSRCAICNKKLPIKPLPNKQLTEVLYADLGSVLVHYFNLIFKNNCLNCTCLHVGKAYLNFKLTKGGGFDQDLDRLGFGRKDGDAFVRVANVWAVFVSADILDCDDTCLWSDVFYRNLNPFVLLQDQGVNTQHLWNHKNRLGSLCQKNHFMLERISHHNYLVLSHLKSFIRTKQYWDFNSKSGSNLIVKVLCELDLELFFHRRDDSYFLQFGGLVSDEEGNFVHLLGLDRFKLQNLWDNLDGWGLLFVATWCKKGLVGTATTNVNFIVVEFVDVGFGFGGLLVFGEGVGFFVEKRAIEHGDKCPIMNVRFLRI